MSATIIHPSFDAFYYSFYIQGIMELFGQASIHFFFRPFPSLSSVCLAFIVRDQRELGVVINAYDGAVITNHVGLQWCDIYGKVNLAWPVIPPREILNAFFYLLGSGCSWRMLPHALPPWRMVYHDVRQWRLDGTWQARHDLLRGAVRVAAGQHRQPSAGVLDRHAVKTPETGGSGALLPANG